MSTDAKPPGAPDPIWLVVFHTNGERHFLTREPIEGILEWAKGAHATIMEYRFAAIVRPPEKAPR